MLLSKIYNSKDSGELEDDKFRASLSYSDFKASNSVSLISSLKLKGGDGEMVLGLRTHTALPEDQSLVPETL